MSAPVSFLTIQKDASSHWKVICKTFPKESANGHSVSVDSKPYRDFCFEDMKQADSLAKILANNHKLQFISYKERVVSISPFFENRWIAAELRSDNGIVFIGKAFANIQGAIDDAKLLARQRRMTYIGPTLA